MSNCKHFPLADDRCLICARRPSDIKLLSGWTWEMVEARRAEHGINDSMVPAASGNGVVAWITVGAARYDMMQAAANLDDMIAIYSAFKKAEGLPELGSADEHLLDGNLTTEQRTFLRNFVSRWEEIEEADKLNDQQGHLTKCDGDCRSDIDDDMFDVVDGSKVCTFCGEVWTENCTKTQCGL